MAVTYKGWLQVTSPRYMQVSRDKIEGLHWLSRPLLVCLSWFEGLELLTWSFLVGWLVTRTYWVAVRMSSSSMEYLLARLNKSSIVASSFLARDSKNDIPGQMLLLKICRMASMLQDFPWRTTYSNRFMNSLKDLFSCILIFYKVFMFYLWWTEHR